MKLDDVLDGFLGGENYSTRAKRCLEDLKKSCISKAKTLQRQELRRLAYQQHTMMTNTFSYSSTHNSSNHNYNSNTNTRAVY
mmetsp:Transcript_17947/g.30554  ORF Transcript_17947/g.30554 Transcript_17947/m.30554 type:complete len:82 (-) Transcript_17947:59-304(-)